MSNGEMINRNMVNFAYDYGSGIIILTPNDLRNLSTAIRVVEGRHGPNIQTGNFVEVRHEYGSIMTEIFPKEMAPHIVRELNK